MPIKKIVKRLKDAKKARDEKDEWGKKFTKTHDEYVHRARKAKASGDEENLYKVQKSYNDFIDKSAKEDSVHVRKVGAVKGYTGFQPFLISKTPERAHERANAVRSMKATLDKKVGKRIEKREQENSQRAKVAPNHYKKGGKISTRKKK